MDEEIQAAPLLLQARENGVDRRYVLDVAGKDEVGAELLGERRDNVNLRAVLSNSFGFGGTNATLVFKHPDA